MNALVPQHAATVRYLTSDSSGVNGLWVVLVLAILAALWLIISVWRRRTVVSPVLPELESITHDMEEEISLLGSIAKHRPLYPEEKYLRSKLQHYRKSLKLVMGDTHNRLDKTK